jgi:hypothetical protein
MDIHLLSSLIFCTHSSTLMMEAASIMLLHIPEISVCQTIKEKDLDNESIL